VPFPLSASFRARIGGLRGRLDPARAQAVIPRAPKPSGSRSASLMSPAEALHAQVADRARP